MFEIVLRRVPDSSTWDWNPASNVLTEWGGDEAVFIGGETPSDAALYWRIELGRLAEMAGDVLAMGWPSVICRGCCRSRTTAT